MRVLHAITTCMPSRPARHDLHSMISACWGPQVFALHPLYLSLRALAPDGSMPAETARKVEEARARLDLPEVDYEGALAAKLEIAREVFEQRGRRELEVCRDPEPCRS